MCFGQTILSSTNIWNKKTKSWAKRKPRLQRSFFYLRLDIYTVYLTGHLKSSLCSSNMHFIITFNVDRMYLSYPVSLIIHDKVPRRRPS